MAKLYDLSDALSKLSRDIDQFTHGGMALDGETAHRLALQVRGYRDQALALEHEVSRHRWNDVALRDQIAAARVVAEASRPGSNLVLFAPACRPFSDGLPKGAA